MNFSRGNFEPEFDVNCACLPKEKHPKSQKRDDIHEIFVSDLVWFARATPEKGSLPELPDCSF